MNKFWERTERKKQYLFPSQTLTLWWRKSDEQKENDKDSTKN